MDARLAACRFYLARALTPSHKSTLLSPAYSPPSIVPFLPPPCSHLIGRSDFTCEAFSLSLAVMEPLHRPAVSKISPLRRLKMTALRPCPFGGPCPSLL